MRRRPIQCTVLAAATGLAAAVVVAPPAQALHLRYWRATVTSVADGDTIWVDLADDGRRRSLPVRMIGIQATETSGSPAGGGAECGARAATAALRRFLPVGSTVRLSAYRAAGRKGTALGVPRLFRFVERRDPRTGAWQDAQRYLLDRGHALWLRSAGETAHVAEYHRAMQRAQARHRGLFSGRCGAGPAPRARLWMWLNYDADDETAANQEYVRIYNPGPAAVSLAGWRLRGGSHDLRRGRTYWRFPAGSRVGPRQAVTVYLGPGRQRPAAGVFHLGIAERHYLPDDDDPRSDRGGQTIYLVDPHLDVRATGDYPCSVACRRPPVEIAEVVPTGTEEVRLRLRPGTSRAQDLSGVVVENDGWTFELAPGTVLAPGETLTVRITADGGTTRLHQRWTHAAPILENTGDTVVLRTAQSTVLDTVSWGSG